MTSHRTVTKPRELNTDALALGRHLLRYHVVIVTRFLGLIVVCWSASEQPTASPSEVGTGVLWVLTGTHQRAPPRQGGGDTRAPTLCGWCCRGRRSRQCRECVITRATFRQNQKIKKRDLQGVPSSPPLPAETAQKNVF